MLLNPRHFLSTGEFIYLFFNIELRKNFKKGGEDAENLGGCFMCFFLRLRV